MGEQVWKNKLNGVVTLWIYFQSNASISQVPCTYTGEITVHELVSFTALGSCGDYWISFAVIYLIMGGKLQESCFCIG